MFNISTVKTALFGLIGLRDSDNPDYPVNTLTGASASVYFDDYHPLITFDNLYEIAPNYDGMNYDKWTATAYATGAYAIYDNVAYKAQQSVSSGDVPSLTSTAWQTPVKDWITTKQYASINKLLNQVFTNKKLNESTKTFLDSVQVVDGAGRLQDTVTPASRFVGYEINLKRANNIKAVINYIGLQFTQAQTDLDIYLFHSSQKTAVGKWTLSSAAATSFDWIDASSPDSGSNVLHYVNYTNNIDSGGTYYLGYFEDDISGSAIEKKIGYYCSDYPDGHVKWSKWAEIRPISVTSSNLDGYNLFDIDAIGYIDTNFGLNFSFSVDSDITEMLVNKKTLFVNAFGYQFASDMLQEMIYNPASRINRKQDNATRSSVLYEWNAPDNKNSIMAQLKDAIDALSFDLSRISQVLPDNRGRGKIKTGAM
jgi:hypothetical protein